MNYVYIYEADIQSYNLCEWVGENRYCSEVTGKVYLCNTAVGSNY